jgi:hypothetical protein
MFRIIDGERPLKPSCDPPISEALWQYMNEYWTENSAMRPATEVVVQQMGLNHGDHQTQHWKMHQSAPLSEVYDKFPLSLFITGVTARDEYPIFGAGFNDIYQASYAGKTVALKHIRTFYMDVELRRMLLVCVCMLFINGL